MAIKFIKERKKQKYLIIGFGAILLVTAVVLWFGYFKKEKPDEFLPIGVVPVREIEINFGVLENPLLIEFQPFVKISTLLIGAKDISLTPTLSWESVPGAEIYFWEIIGVASDKTTETSVTVSEKLKPSTTYIWRVKSCNKDGTECSAWSNNCQVEEGLGCWRFTTVEKPSLILISPFLGAKDISLTPTLSWESVPGTEIYFWEIIGVASDKTTETSVTVSEKLKPSTTYVWRVMSCKEGGAECSAWSNRTFTTVIFLFPPGLVSPQAEEIFVGRENPFLPY